MTDRKDRPARQEAEMLDSLFQERRRSAGKRSKKQVSNKKRKPSASAQTCSEVP